MALWWRHPTTRRTGAAVAALAVMAAVAVGPARSAGAAGVLPVGQAATLSAPGVNLSAPADGAINGYDFHGQVTGTKCGPSAGSRSEAVTAAAGGEICVFTVHVTADKGLYLLGAAPTFPPALSVTAGSVRVPIPLTPAVDQAEAGGTFAVGVPAGVPAALVATAQGYSQSFDLRAAKRLAPAPTALYRTTDMSVIDITPQTTASLTATRSDTGEQSSWHLIVSDAYVGFFSPIDNVPAPSADQGYVVVEGTMGSSDPAASDLSVPSLPGSDVHLALPGGQTITGEAVAPQAAGNTQNQDLFPHAYAFLVPGDITAATLQVQIPDPVPTQSLATPTQPNLAFTGTATIPLGWAGSPSQTPQTATPQRQSNTPPARPVAAKGTALTPGKAALRGLEIAAIVAAILAAVYLVARRRRRLLPASPVTGSQLALMAATQSELSGVVQPPAIGSGPAALPPGTPPANGNAQTTNGSAHTDNGSGPRLVLRVLGPLEVEGLAKTIRRKVLVRLLVCLALAPGRAVPVEELRDSTALDPERSSTASTIHEAASRLRSHLPAGLFPPIPPGVDGYRLAEGVEVDWALFVELTGRASNLGDSDRLELSCRALRLVRGTPLAGGSWPGVDSWIRHIETSIETVAADTARLALGLRDARSADWAASQGLLAVPGSPSLHELRLVAAAGGSGIGLDRAWGQTCEALGPDAQPLNPTYEKLRAGSY